MTGITVKIRSSTGSTFELQMEPEALTVYELKELLTKSLPGTTAANLRLVYSGRILKDPDMVSSYKAQFESNDDGVDIGDGHVIHVVKTGSSKPQEQASTADRGTSIATTSQPISSPYQSREANNVTLPTGLGGFGGLGGASMPDPELMRGMMESP
ncbi:unnamed protein product [Umbelopsis vinacea]